MAKQKGPLKLTGTIGDITYYTTQDGDLAREKSNLTKERVLTDPAFKNSRRASSEFGRASAAGAMIRKAFALTAKDVQEYSTHHRLSSLLREVMESDTKHKRGEKQLLPGNLQPLEGFEWNKGYQFCEHFKEHYKAVIEGNTGKMHVEVASFDPKQGLKIPAGSSHFKLIAAGTALDLNKSKYSQGHAESDFISCSQELISPQLIELRVPQPKGRILVLGIGLQFYQKVGSVYSELKEGGCFCIAGVQTGKG